MYKEKDIHDHNDKISSTKSKILPLIYMDIRGYLNLFLPTKLRLTFSSTDNSSSAKMPCVICRQKECINNECCLNPSSSSSSSSSYLLSLLLFTRSSSSSNSGTEIISINNCKNRSNDDTKNRCKWPDRRKIYENDENYSNQCSSYFSENNNYLNYEQTHTNIEYASSILKTLISTEAFPITIIKTSFLTTTLLINQKFCNDEDVMSNVQNMQQNNQLCNASTTTCIKINNIIDTNSSCNGNVSAWTKRKTITTTTTNKNNNNNLSDVNPIKNNFKLTNYFLSTFKNPPISYNLLKIVFAIYLVNFLLVLCNSSSIIDNNNRYSPNFNEKFHETIDVLIKKREIINKTTPARLYDKNEVVCSSIDVRNDDEEIEKHKNCTVIEGFLTITNLEMKLDADRYTFPKLTEITDFLMVYRFKGLKSLGTIFPNLTVIRGTILFEQFALVIFENINLENIGLHSLTTIKRGAVRIANNADLCFVETIDWNIIVDDKENNIFFENRDKRDCESCPKGINATDGIYEKIPADCSASNRCWNIFHCQKVCPKECPNNCQNEIQCCNENCLGGCDKNDKDLCVSCKDYTHNGKCVDKCDGKLLKYSDRSCITKDACKTKQKYQNEQTLSAVAYNDSCVINCPHGYRKDGDKATGYTCKECIGGFCDKLCQGESVDSIADAKKFRECSNITDDLIINLRQGGKHLMEELEDSFQNVRFIHASLRVVRSFALPSLSFFKNLQEISGFTTDESQKSQNQNYSLYVLENNNLQSIWGEGRTVRIARGRVFFHFNEKLCYNKIENLRRNMTRGEEFTPTEVSNTTNGNRGSCNMTILETKVVISDKGAVVTVLNPISYDDERWLISYQYYVIEAPDKAKNITKYDYRTTCGNEAWRIDDQTKKPYHSHPFTHLRPYTRYAYYVRTETIADKPNGESEIDYFITLPGQPDPVRNLRIVGNSTTPHSFLLNWQPPRRPNGNLTIYKIILKFLPDPPIRNEERCNHTDNNEDYYPTNYNKPSKIEEDVCQQQCSCNADSEDKKVDKKNILDYEDEIHFENALQNFIFVKKVNQSSNNNNNNNNNNKYNNNSNSFSNDLNKKRLRRAIMDGTENNIGNNLSEFPLMIDITPPYDPLEKINKWHNSTTKDYFIYFYAEVPANTTQYEVKNLRHFGTYNIVVRACHDGKSKNCSDVSDREGRTQFIQTKDLIRDLRVEVEGTNNTRTNIVRISWLPPKDPNGIILWYTIYSRKIDYDNEEPQSRCVYIENLIINNITNRLTFVDKFAPGKYEIKVKANTRLAKRLQLYSAAEIVTIYPGSLTWGQIVGICIGIALLIAVISIIVFYVRRKFYTQQPDLKLITSVNPEYISMQYTPDEWEIPRDKIIQLRELGQGSFGMVYEGIIKHYDKNEENTSCAVKTVNESATDRERINFLNEASVMKEFDTHHVVRLLGVVSRGQPTLVVMELMINGDLKAYLRRHRPDPENCRDGEPPPQPPTLRRILQMAIEIADGMAYLSAKKFVHRDLAARNCMVADDLTVKIGDFGMTRDIYETDYYRKGTKGLLPVRWMSPESLKDGVFSSASDIFSYGVVLWEMATLASQPYQGLSNDQVLRYVIDGGIMERPENCPDKLYDLMAKCWQHRPSARPSFMEIIEQLLDEADIHFRDVSFYHSPAGREVFEQLHPVTDLDDVTTPLRVGYNTSIEQADSNLNEDDEPHSPYSLGSAILIGSTPGATSKHSLNHYSSPPSLKQIKTYNINDAINEERLSNKYTNGEEPTTSTKKFPKNEFSSTLERNRTDKNSSQSSTLPQPSVVPKRGLKKSVVETVQNVGGTWLPKLFRKETLRKLTGTGGNNNKNSNQVYINTDNDFTNNSSNNSNGQATKNQNKNDIIDNTIVTTADEQSENGKNSIENITPSNTSDNPNYQILNESNISVGPTDSGIVPSVINNPYSYNYGDNNKKIDHNDIESQIPKLTSRNLRRRTQQNQQCNLDLTDSNINDKNNGSNKNLVSNLNTKLKDEKRPKKNFTPYQLKELWLKQTPAMTTLPNGIIGIPNEKDDKNVIDTFNPVIIPKERQNFWTGNKSPSHKQYDRSLTQDSNSPLLELSNLESNRDVDEITDQDVFVTSTPKRSVLPPSRSSRSSSYDRLKEDKSNQDQDNR